MTIIAIQKSQSRWRYRLLLAALLTGVAMLASGSSTPDPATRPMQLSNWRRTRDGWEQSRWLMPKQPPPAATLHPLSVAVLIILLAAMSLVGYTPRLGRTAVVPPPHVNVVQMRRCAELVHDPSVIYPP